MGHERNKRKGNAEGELALNLLIIDYCFVRSQFAALLSLLLLLFVACLLLQIENANCSSDLPARSRCGRSCSRSRSSGGFWCLATLGGKTNFHKFLKQTRNTKNQKSKTRRQKCEAGFCCGILTPFCCVASCLLRQAKVQGAAVEEGVVQGQGVRAYARCFAHLLSF